MATLKIASGSLAGQVIDLNIEQNFVGRGSQNDIKITDPGVSGKHAKLWCEANQWYVMDLGSTNGTLVNGADIDRESLNDGDKITFGTVQAVFNTSAARRAPAPVGRPGPVARAPAPVAAPAGPDPRAGELEIELSTLQARYTTLEKEIDKVRAEAAANEARVAEAAVQGMKAEMQKLRDLMRERDDSMRIMEERVKERETWFSPAEVERERKRFEASAGAESATQIAAFQRQIKELEAKVVARAAEYEASQRSLREKDDLIRMLSEREDRAGGVAKEKDDKLNELSERLKKLEEELATSAAKEKEANEKLKQKNTQLAEMGQQQAILTQEIAKARALAARVSAGDTSGAAEQAAAAAAENAQLKQQALQLRNKLNEAQEAVITANSARDQEAQKAAAANKQVDELHGQLTDLNDEKAQLQSRLDELMTKHSAFQEAEHRIAGLEAELAQFKAAEEHARKAADEAIAKAGQLQKERVDLEAKMEAQRTQYADMEADYKVMKLSRDQSFDWEARYKSQVDDFESMRRQNGEMKATIEALEAQVARGGGGGGVDNAVLELAKARSAVLEEMAGGMLEGINNSVSILRRNAQVLQGYVHDCGLLANCVRQINYTLLEPEQQQMLRELIDETQPDVIIKNMESIGEEDSEAINKGKRLILDYQEAMKRVEDATELESCFAKSQGLVQAVDPSGVRVKVGRALPPIAPAQPETVLFCYSLLREAKSLAVDEDTVPNVRVDADGSNITLIVSPVHPRVKDRYRETAAGGGDTRSQYIVGFATQMCGGRVDAKDMGEGAALFITLAAAQK